MSERPRCSVIERIGEKADGTNRYLRAICDRPKGHPGWQHKGRLAAGQDVIGLIEWPRVQPK